MTTSGNKQQERGSDGFHVFASPAFFITAWMSYSVLRGLRLRIALASSSLTNISLAASQVSLRLSFMPIHAVAQAARLRADWSIGATGSRLAAMLSSQFR